MQKLHRSRLHVAFKKTRILPPNKFGKIYEPTVYGNFLLKKVRNNFAIGGGKYD
jgi:hypothetical protein